MLNSFNVVVASNDQYADNEQYFMRPKCCARMSELTAHIHYIPGRMESRARDEGGYGPQ